jgi:hypothetical protein
VTSSNRHFLSIVVAARNDNYGGTFEHRFQNFVHWNSQLLEVHKLGTEIVIVNWNPVPAAAPLRETIRFPKLKHVAFRMIDVPHELHASFDSDSRVRVPLYEFPAKNVGIARAKGTYILCTNADVLFHPELVRYLGAKRVDPHTYYRTERCDFTAEIDAAAPYQSTLESIEGSVIAVYTKGARKSVRRRLDGEALRRLKRRNETELTIKRKLEATILSLLPGKHKTWIYNPSYELFLHASGDFTLSHRDNWFSLRGYPETTYMSTHTDSLFLAMLKHNSIRECRLEWPVYHQEHARRYEVDSQSRSSIFRRQYEFLVRETWNMKLRKRPTIYNDETWGLRKHELEEIEL